jgi:hypothetical protein
MTEVIDMIKSVFGSLVLILWASTAALAQGGTASPPMLAVQGTGEVRLAPDLAIVRLGVSEQLPAAADAQARVNAVASAIIEGVVATGIAPDQIQTSGLTLAPVYSRVAPGGNEPPRIVAYNASNTVTIRVGDLARVGAVIDRALEEGANRLEGVSFTLEDDVVARQDALRAAVEDALGVGLGGILSIAEGGVGVQPIMMEMAPRMMAMQADTGTPVSQGEVSVHASVSVQYRIVD